VLWGSAAKSAQLNNEGGHLPWDSTLVCLQYWMRPLQNFSEIPRLYQRRSEKKSLEEPTSSGGVGKSVSVGGQDSSSSKQRAIPRSFSGLPPRQ